MKKRVIGSLIGIALVVLLIPQHPIIPVKGASRKDWNPKSFWYYPWGKSLTHKGIDIFAKEGTPVLSAVPGLVLYAGTIGMGGKVVLMISSKWRLHYYAHLQHIQTGLLRWVSQGKVIGSVGTTGNAVGKSPHLHYSIVSALPLFWRMDSSIHGWKKAFYLNPDELIARQ